MTQIEEIRRPAQAADWPGAWRNAAPPPVPPAWYYPPPAWYAPPPVEEPPAQRERVEKLTYSVEEAAQVLNLSRSTVYTLIHRQDFPTLKVGKRRLIFREGLAEWVRRHAGC